MSEQALFSVTADWHFHEGQEFVRPGGRWSSRLDDQLRVFREWCTSPARGTHAVIAGDLVHTRGRLSPAVAAAIAEAMETASTAFKQVYVLPGNHDCPRRYDADVVHSLSWLQGFRDNVQVVSTPCAVPGPGFPLYLLPWRPSPEEFRDAVGRLIGIARQEAGPKYLIGHQLVDGSENSFGKALESRVTVADLNAWEWDWIVLGDVHRPQTLPGVGASYVGSPYQIDRGERGEEKRFLYFLEGRASPDSMPLLEGPKFFEVTVHDLSDLCGLATTPYVDARLADGAETNAEEIRRALGHRVIVHRGPGPLPEETREARLRGVTAASPVAEVFDSYLREGYTGELDTGTLRELGEEVLSAGKGGESGGGYSGPLTFHRLRAVNFLGYGDVEVPLSGQGLVLIDGENRDQIGFFSSNGAGKSTLIEAVYWCLFGATLRTLRVDDVPNRNGDGSVLVELDVETEGARYRIVRARNHRQYGTGLHIFEKGPEGEELDASLGGARGNSEVAIRQRLGVDTETFRSAVLFGQNVEAYFAEARPSEQQAILDRLANTGRFDSYGEAAKRLREEHRRQEAELRSQADRIEVRVRTLSEERDSVAEKAAEWKQGHDDRVETCDFLLHDAETELKSARKAEEWKRARIEEKDTPGKIRRNEDLLLSARMDLATTRGRFDEGLLGALRADREREESQLGGWRNRLEFHKERENGLRGNLSAAKVAAEELPDWEANLRGGEEQVKALDAEVYELDREITRREASGGREFLRRVQDSGKKAPCPTCGKPLTPAQAKERLLKIEEEDRELETLRKTHREKARELEHLRSNVQEFAGKVQLRRSLASREVEHVKALREFEEEKLRLEEEITSHVDRIRELSDKITEVEKSLNSSREAVKIGESRVEALEREKRLLKVDADEEAHELRKAREWMEAWELKAADYKEKREEIAREVCPYDPEEINLRVQNAEEELRDVRQLLDDAELLSPYWEELVTIFGNRGLKVFVYDALGPQIERVAAEALDVLVDGTISVRFETSRGKQSLREGFAPRIENEHGAASYGGDSGGERRMVDLAMLWALHSLVQHRINLLKVDEAVAPLDNRACERVLRLFEQRAEQNPGATFLFTTHRSEMKDAFPKVWVAVKENGVTRIERGAET